MTLKWSNAAENYNFKREINDAEIKNELKIVY